ncbi:MAG TPA: peptide-methionine (S)-S-oxide reductase MsrA [Pyrinomonadaceae bacterium]|nr:peptide-methionine (S)-S-oxide reductase MsrA [Pyrinomonadaceae bacterium]
MKAFFTIAVLVLLGGMSSCGSVSSSGVAGSPGDLGSLGSPERVETDPSKLKTAVFAGGCFWGVEAVFEWTRGVADARSGYSGGTKESANYDLVSAGKTKHAEAVEVRFDPEVVSYEQLLDIFFRVIHDPTQLNRQGPDVGAHYRSAIFYVDDEQRAAAGAYIERLAAERVYKKPIVTQLIPLEAFYPAEEYHQDFLRKNPNDPYIVYHDIPKLEKLKKTYPKLWAGK